MSIPKDQKCQAFDPMMYLPEKSLYIIKDPSKASTSCIAPAFVYLEGSRGKRFLCDFHYYYEKNMTLSSRPDLWKDIEKILIDQRELIKDTFSKNTTSTETVGYKCSISSICSSDAFVKLIPKENSMPIPRFYCNFHFRKIYYRYYSNDIIFENKFTIIDERYRMTSSIAEESENLSSV